MLHYGKLAYGTEYYIAIPMSSIDGTLAGKSFLETGFAPTSKTWHFTTRANPVAEGKTAYTVDCAEAS